MIRAIALASVFAGACSLAHGQPPLLGEPWDSAATGRGVDPVLLYAVCLVESQTSWSDGLVRPDPYVVRIDGAVMRAESADALRQVVVAAHEAGRRVEDVGVCQIHWPSHRRRLASPDLVTDPVANINYAAEVLATALASTSDPIVGIGRYHSWTDWRARAYGYRVWQVYQRLSQVLVLGMEGDATAPKRAREDSPARP